MAKAVAVPGEIRYNLTDLTQTEADAIASVFAMMNHGSSIDVFGTADTATRIYKALQKAGADAERFRMRTLDGDSASNFRLVENSDGVGRERN